MTTSGIPRASGRLGRARSSGDRGVGTIEYLGVVVLAAMLVAALVLVMASGSYRRSLDRALCQLASFGQGSCASAGATAARSPADYIPHEVCVIGADGESGSVTAGVLLTGGASGSWLVEELSDGTFRLTRGGSAQGGVQVGVGFDVSVTKDDYNYGAGAQASAGASIVVGGGEVFHASSMDEAKAILAARNVSDVKTAIVGDGVGRDVVDGVQNFFGGDTSKESTVPDETFVEGGQNIEGSAGLNATVVNANAEGSVTQMLGLTSREDGTSTGYFASEAEVSGSLQGMFPGVNDSVQYGDMTGTLAGKVILEVDYDDDGTVTAVRTRTSYTVDGSNGQAYNSPDNITADPNVVHEVTAELPIRTDADRAVAVRMLQSAGIPYVPGMSDGFDVVDYASNRLGMYDATVDFVTASRDSGQVWRQTSTEDSTTNGFNFDAAWIAEVELSAESTSTRNVLTGYDYWDGTTFTPRNGCGGGVQ